MSTKAGTRWHRIGFYATPAAIASSFADELVASPVLARLKSAYRLKQRIDIIDLCAGDGRLGRVISERLGNEGIQNDVTFVEANPSRARACSAASPKSRVIEGNAFEVPAKKFDLVISNPPFLVLTREMSKKLGIEWESAAAAGRNLYGLALRRSLELCKPGGCIAFIAPFGWMTGTLFASLRGEILRKTAQVVVHAKDDRNFFPGVRQDIAFQFFVSRRNGRRKTKAQVSLGFNGHPYKSATLRTQSSNRAKSDSGVRVGPLVWNRSKDLLSSSSRGATLLINGGNINHEGRLNLEDARYSKRQFVRLNDGQKDFVSRGPMLLIRRTMRGAPGKWKIDSCLVTNDVLCVAENHVIVVELPSGYAVKAYRAFARALTSRLLDRQRNSGSPNLSVVSVRDTVRLELKTLKGRSKRMFERYSGLEGGLSPLV